MDFVNEYSAVMHLRALKALNGPIGAGCWIRIRNPSLPASALHSAAAWEVVRLGCTPSFVCRVLTSSDTSS